MNEQSELLVKILHDLNKNESEIDIFKRIGLCALDIICGKKYILIKLIKIKIKLSF